MANIKHEDAILKMGFEYFRDTILKTLGIDYEFVESGIGGTDDSFFVYGFYISYNRRFLYPYRIPDNRFR